MSYIFRRGVSFDAKLLRQNLEEKSWNEYNKSRTSVLGIWDYEIKSGYGGGKMESETLLKVLRREKESRYSGGIYHKTQVDLTFNSNHIEGSRLTHEQTRYIFETNTVGVENEALNVDDILETVNHFRCIDLVIDHAEDGLTEGMIKELHRVLKTGTSDSRLDWFAVGEYKRVPNEVGGMVTALPEEVAGKMETLLSEYRLKESKTLEDLLEFHVMFERLHPFQDGKVTLRHRQKAM